jgi:glycogen operon protein
MGDEVCRTQRGNNNAYCQDNDLSWMDWSLAETNADLFRFFSRMIAFRKRHPMLERRRFFTGEANERGIPDIQWHGCKLNGPGWDDPSSRVLSFTMGGPDGDADVHVILNMDHNDQDFEIPSIPDRKWEVAIDTALASPDDIADPGKEKPHTGTTYRATGRSVVVLIAK